MNTAFSKKDLFVLLSITLIFCCFVPFFYMKQGLLSIDTGRDFYIAERMLKGDVLYKDILNIYGILPYILNAFLFLIFGVKLKTLYVAGLITSFGILSLIYLISREFLTRGTSFLITLTAMFSLVFGVFLYNSVIPYTFSITYALFFFLASVFFLLKYLKTENKFFAYFACFAAGGAFACKYEFLPYIFVLIYVFRDFDIKTALKSLLLTLFLPFFGLLLLFIQGLNFEDIKNAIILLNKTVNSPSLAIFYKYNGVFPDFGSIVNLFVKNKIFAIFAFLPLVNFILLLKNIKKIHSNKPLFVFLLCSLSVCFKSFFYLNVNHYGIYVFPICLISFVLLTEKILNKYINTILIATIFIFGAYNFDMLQHKTYKVESAKGYIYTFKKDGKPVNSAIKYIEANTDSEDTVLILPEGSIVNFLTGRKTLNTYYSLIPLYYDDVFGEDKIISDFLKNPPEVIMIMNNNTKEYGKNHFGDDYGKNFYEMIVDKYKLVQDNELKIFIRKESE